MEAGTLQAICKVRNAWKRIKRGVRSNRLMERNDGVS